MADSRGTALMLEWLRRGWLLSIGAFLCVFIWTEHEAISAQLGSSEPMLLVAVVAAILIAKLLCMDLAYGSLMLLGQNCRYIDAAFWYSNADIGKYLPGGIWPTLGRLAMYGAHFPPAVAGRALMAETLTLIGIPLIVGIAVTQSPFGAFFTVALVFCSSLVLMYILVRVDSVAIQSSGMLRSQRLTLTLRCVAGQLVCWLVLFPGSVYLLICGVDFSRVLAAFDIAFALGQLAIFAPSGIGVREMTFDFLLGGRDSSVVISILIFHRTLWLLADIIFFVAVLKIRNSTVTLSK